MSDFNSRQLYVGEDFNPDLVYVFYLSKLRRHELWNLFTDLPKEIRKKYEFLWPYVKTSQLLPALYENFLDLDKTRMFTQFRRIIQVKIEHNIKVGHLYYMSDQGEDEYESNEEDDRLEEEALVARFDSALYV